MILRATTDQLFIKELTMKLFALILIATSIFSVNSSKALSSASLKPEFYVDPIVVLAPVLSDPCFSANYKFPLENCLSIAPDTGTTWYKKTISCDAMYDGTKTGKLISKYFRYSETVGSDEKIYVTIEDQIIFDTLTAWGRSVNDTYNHWGAMGVTSNILGSDFTPVDLKLKYLYSDYNSIPQICFWEL